MGDSLSHLDDLLIKDNVGSPPGQLDSTQMDNRPISVEQNRSADIFYPLYSPLLLN